MCVLPSYGLVETTNNGDDQKKKKNYTQQQQEQQFIECDGVSARIIRI